MVPPLDQEFQQDVTCEIIVVDHPNLYGGELDDDGRLRRTGTVWTASAHIITAIIGSGVLSLAWGMAQLGWVIGVGTLLVFSCITLYTSSLLADCYRSPDPVAGKRNRTYMEAVKATLGGKIYKLCGWLQYTFLCGLAVGYTITATMSMAAMFKSNCFHKEGHGAPCEYSNNLCMIGMGLVEILLSQIPNIHKMSWLSVVAAIMSFGYASIGMGLSLAKIISGKGARNNITGLKAGMDLTSAAKTWAMFRAIGDMAFACTYSVVLIEIQDTLKSPPAENKSMKKASMIAIVTSTAFYLMCGSLGYAALGNQAPGNMITGFGFYEPFWLISLANLFIVVHLVGAYQVISQPVFNAIETWATMKRPKSKFVAGEYPIRIGNYLNINLNITRLTWRTLYVVLATVLAMALPFFNDVLALLGAVGYWPMTVCLPVEMYIAQKKIQRRTVKWFGLEVLNLACLLVAVAAGCGAIQGFYQALRTYKPFNL